jgi:hypothetical protein
MAPFFSLAVARPASPPLLFECSRARNIALGR